MTQENLSIFIVVGRLPKSLVKSKVEPIAKSKFVKKVYVFCQEKGFDIKDVNYIILPKILNSNNFFIKLLRLFYEPLQLYFYCLRYRPNLIKGIYVFPKGFNSLLLSRIYGCKCMVSNIGGLPEILTYYKSFKKLRKSFNLFIYKKADYVTTKGYSIINYFINQGLDKSKISVYNGSIDTNFFIYDKNKNKPIDILFVGSFIRRKGPDRVVEIIKILIKKYKILNLSASFLGKGELYDDIQQKIIDEGLGKNIQLHNHVDHTANYFAKSKVLIMPSISEGLSTAMLEAMSSGCVPVVSDVGEMTKAAFDNINSFVVREYDDLLSFADKVNTLLSDNVKRNKMAEAARNNVVAEYSIETQMKQFDLLLKKIFNK